MALNPQSLADVLADVQRVGAAAGAACTAADLQAQLAARIERVRAATADVPLKRRPCTAPVEWLEPVMLSGNWVPELVELAGGRHELTTAGAHSPQVAWADLAAYDPDVVVLVPCGFDLARTLAEWEPLRSQPTWSSLRAVRSGRTFAVDGNAYFNRPGPRLVESLEILAHLLHPERCRAQPRRIRIGLAAARLNRRAERPAEFLRFRPALPRQWHAARRSPTLKARSNRSCVAAADDTTPPETREVHNMLRSILLTAIVLTSFGVIVRRRADQGADRRRAEQSRLAGDDPAA